MPARVRDGDVLLEDAQLEGAEVVRRAPAGELAREVVVGLGRAGRCAECQVGYVEHCRRSRNCADAGECWRRRKLRLQEFAQTERWLGLVGAAGVACCAPWLTFTARLHSAAAVVFSSAWRTSTVPPAGLANNSTRSATLTRRRSRITRMATGSLLTLCPHSPKMSALGIAHVPDEAGGHKLRSRGSGGRAASSMRAKTLAGLVLGMCLATTLIGFGQALGIDSAARAAVRRLLAAGVVEPYVPDWVPRAAELRASIVQAPAPQRDYHPPNAAPAARRSLAVLAPFICLLVVAVVVLNVVLATRSEA